MRTICLFVMLCISLVGFGRDKNYGNKVEQNAVRCAFRLLMAYYSPDELCVSDSIYDLDWQFFARKVDGELKREFDYYRIDRKEIYAPASYSKILSKIFSIHKCSCSQHKYVAQFSAPYKGYIRCDIMPIDGKVGMYASTSIIPLFLFRYDDEGKVDEMFTNELTVD